MKILKNELSKIFDIRAIILLSVFTAAFFYLFTAASLYPHNYVSWPGSVEFHAELVQKFGSELSVSEWDSFMEYKSSLISEVNKYIAQNEILSEAGITTHEELRNIQDDIFTKKDKTEQENNIYREINNMWDVQTETGIIMFKIQDIERIERSFEQNRWGTSENEAKALIAPQYSAALRNREMELRTRTDVSLISDAPVEMLSDDIVKIIILVFIWNFVLILPYQIGERIRGVIPIFASTKTGRKIFSIEFTASLISGIVCWLAVSAAYLIIIGIKGAFVFKDCIISNEMNSFWIDINYMGYIFINFLATFIIGLASTSLAYLIGRLSSNYISALAISIPVGAAFCVIVNLCTYNLFVFNLHIDFTLLIVRLAVLFLTLAAIFFFIFLRMSRDRKCDLL